MSYRQSMRHGKGDDALWPDKVMTDRQASQLKALGLPIDGNRGAASRELVEFYARRERQKTVGFDTDPRYIDYGG